MTDIVTKQTRALRSRAGKILIRKLYYDKPGNIETWDENAAKIAKEFSLDPTDVHLTLMRAFPDYYGVPK